MWYNRLLFKERQRSTNTSGKIALPPELLLVSVVTNHKHQRSGIHPITYINASECKQHGICKCYLSASKVNILKPKNVWYRKSTIPYTHLYTKRYYVWNLLQNTIQNLIILYSKCPGYNKNICHSKKQENHNLNGKRQQ